MFFNLEMTDISIFNRCVASVMSIPLKWLRAGGKVEAHAGAHEYEPEAVVAERRVLGREQQLLRPRADQRVAENDEGEVFIRATAADDGGRTVLRVEVVDTGVGVDPAKLVSILNYDGMPITADNIYRQIIGQLKNQ